MTKVELPTEDELKSIFIALGIDASPWQLKLLRRVLRTKGPFTI